MFNPISTYRIQFHRDFKLGALAHIIPYLQQLGVKTLYASPIFRAVPGSGPGYDLTDANCINPEIGTIEQLYEVSSQLKKAGISWLQDIVPNHMALHEDNHWLMDVLKYGRASKYADYFDIDWSHPACDGKLMLPVLDRPVDEAIEHGKLYIDEADDELWLQYGMRLPLQENSKRLWTTADRGRDPRGDGRKEVLKAILNRQHYMLMKYSSADEVINYRRFFTINGLISLNMQHRHVFDSYH